MYEALPVYTSTDRTVEPVDLSLVDRSLLSPGEVDFYLQNLAVPYRYDDDGLVIAVASDDAGGRASFDAFFEEPVRLVLADRRELLAYVDSQFRTLLSDDAVLALAKAEPQLSARQTITRAQSATLLTLGFILVFGLVFRTYDAVLGLVLALSAGFVANVFFRGLLVWVGAGEANEAKTTFQRISDEKLPLYTILVPLYREANVLPALMQALAALDYPGIR